MMMGHYNRRKKLASRRARSKNKAMSTSKKKSLQTTMESRTENNREDNFDERVNQDQDDVDGELDPRVQQELEKLNACMEEINALETQLEDANSLFRTLLTDSTQQLKANSKRLGSCIEKARPYYEALEIAQRAQKECQSAATHYQRASGIHAAAKETIALAEERFLTNSNHWEFDNAWQEMLNHATMKVMEAEKQKTESEAEHLRRADSFQAAEAEVQKLEKKLKGVIQKSRPYFEQKDVFNKALESQKLAVHDLQHKILTVKKCYAKSLRNLEDISESIHAQRKVKSCQELMRKHPAGSELRSLPSYDLEELSSIRSGCTTASSTTSTRRDEDESDDIGSVDEGLSMRFEKQFSFEEAEQQMDKRHMMIRSSSAPVNVLNSELRHPPKSPSILEKILINRKKSSAKHQQHIQEPQKLNQEGEANIVQEEETNIVQEEETNVKVHDDDQEQEVAESPTRK